MAGRETFDISPLQKEILEHRTARRNKLRYEYLKQTQNPYRHALGVGGIVDDIAVNRFMAMKVRGAEFFRPTVKNAAFFWIGMLGPILLTTYIVRKRRIAKETKLRSGLVSYRDRDFACN
ncbi:uncharacterized protein LOC123260303 [Cotesia glomerata]|uniref:NADH dehydrogenase [ubiquinone] 1 beta subcomplex subunit 4 n=1 Tax=Cotesia glomerata TaxID=32391 RepID=A0AAV7IGS6_COTGL|nr:uncharacterized protein LOC123260303 [Cotesia glomerata]KAH0550387.1 hypothetical protein KQX54_019101 [Cotesia glomerata]